jgi:hypothetical protein
MANPLDALKELQQYKEDQKRKAAERERPKADWFMWTANGEKGGKKIDTVMGRFLNDWNTESELGAKNGAPILKVEHTAPGDQGYKRRALCTKELEGECYPCERHALRIEADKGGWKQRTNFYINALVEFPEGAKKVVIMSRNANASFVDDLITELEDEKDISGANYRIKVTGEKTTTKWGLKRQSSEPFDVSAVEAYDLEELAVRHVPYAEQAEYFGAVYQSAGEPAPSGDSAPTANSAAAADAEW